MVERASWERLNDTQVGQYHLRRLLDQHQWGPIFQAEDASSQRFAVHFIGQPGSEEEQNLPAEQRLVYTGRAQQIANQLAGLQHPRIVPVVDYGLHQGMPYIVYPYQRAETLRGMLKARGMLDLLTVGRLLEQITEGLRYGHSRGVLHRNLSSLSIFVRSDQRILLDEFGLLALRELYKQYFPPPASAEFDGTSEASAPEQWLRKPIDTYADIYALGAVLYRMLSGHAPFEGNTREEVMQMHLTMIPGTLSIWRQNLPEGLDALLAKALAKEPGERFQRPEDLLQGYWGLVSAADAARVRAEANQYREDEERGGRIAVGKAGSETPGSPGYGQLVHTTSASARVGSQVSSQSASRRQFLTIAALSGIGVLGVGGAIGWAVSAKSGESKGTQVTNGAGVAGKTAASQGTLIARQADLPLNEAKTFAINGQKNPGILIHLPDNRFVAFDSTCTHAGCAVTYRKSDHELVCPCHDAVFDPANKAAVLQGPATTALTSITIKINADGTITMS